ncbi:hypothetical protein GCM10025886_01300 [Tetragenococcus halophilus subsp. flandriensis]|nr:hypothetical protein GCM10025886_01300 [Tetragenococcus halophilus subsp. flandriensis]
MTADFVIIKATGGTGYVNPYCDKHFQQAKQAGKLLGVYHYANEVGYEGTAKQEADFFVKNAKNYLKGDAIPVLDWEASNKGDVQWALDWLNEVEKQTGIKPWFYTYTAVLDSYDFTRIADNDNALWVANYGANKRSNGYNKNATPPSTRGFKNGAACFQYSSNTVIPGYGSPIDVDIFYGDKTAWNAYATPSSGGKDWSKQYYTTNPGKVKAKTSIGVYAANDVEFENKLSTRKKGTVITTKGIKHAGNGCPRLVTSKGNLISANKDYVQKIDSENDEPSGKIDENGKFDSATAKRLQQIYNRKICDGVISGQIKNKANENVYAAEWGTGGSIVIKKIQEELGLDPDGNIGPATVKAMQKKLGTAQDGIISPRSDMVKAMQKKLNTGKRPF